MGLFSQADHAEKQWIKKAEGNTRHVDTTGMERKKAINETKKLFYDNMEIVDAETLEKFIVAYPPNIASKHTGSTQHMTPTTTIILVDDNVVSSGTLTDAYRVLFKSGILNHPGIFVMAVCLHDVK